MHVRRITRTRSAKLRVGLMRQVHFKREWVGASPCNKLCFYGVAKLRLLAKRKLPKGHWKLDREGLITALSPLVRDAYFPTAA